jgi:hypothetical protein
VTIIVLLNENYLIDIISHRNYIALRHFEARDMWLGDEINPPHSFISCGDCARQEIGLLDYRAREFITNYEQRLKEHQRLDKAII